MGFDFPSDALQCYTSTLHEPPGLYSSVHASRLAIAVKPQSASDRFEREIHTTTICAKGRLKVAGLDDGAKAIISQKIYWRIREFGYQLLGVLWRSPSIPRRERTHSSCDYTWTNTGSSFTVSYCLVLGYGRDAIRLVRATKEFSSGV